jgi:hypothetical protein
MQSVVLWKKPVLMEEKRHLWKETATYITNGRKAAIFGEKMQLMGENGFFGTY